MVPDPSRTDAGRAGGGWVGVGVRLPFSESPEFRKLLAGDGPTVDLARVALEVAADASPGLDPEPPLRYLDALADRVRDRCDPEADPRRVLGQINWALFVEEEFRGNAEEYYDPRNSDLNEVIGRKLGIPISLSILYWRLAGRLGLAVDGVNMPVHFLLRTGRGPETIFIDPFHDGALLDRAACRRLFARLAGPDATLHDAQLAPCRPAQVVARLLRNLKAIHLRSHDYPALLPVQRRLAALHPDDPGEQRDLGMLALKIDRPAEAVAPLQDYLNARPDAADADDVAALIRAARREVAGRN